MFDTVDRNNKQNILSMLIDSTKCNQIPCFCSSYSLGFDSIKKKILNDTNKSDKYKKNVIKKLDDILIDMQIILINYFKNIDVKCEQVIDLLKEMFREMIYCKFKKLTYNFDTISEKFLSIISESSLHNQTCFKCHKSNSLKSCRTQCTDIYCSNCNLKIEIKMKRNTQKDKQYICLNSGIPEGVTTWKNNNGVLVVFKEDGYSYVESKDVIVSDYIEGLPTNWRTHYKKTHNKTKKTNMKVNKQDLRKLNLDVPNWNDYKHIICKHLNNIHEQLFGYSYYHDRPIYNAIQYFMSILNKNNITNNIANNKSNVI